MRPEARIAKAHAAVTRGPSPRPRNAIAVSSPASAAMSERLAQKQTLTACPSSITATMGDRFGISSAFHPVKLCSSSCRSSTNTMLEGGAITSGNENAGPESTSPLTSDVYRSACKGASRRSEAGGSSRARPSSSSAMSRGTSARTAQARLEGPRMSENSGPGPGSGSRVAATRPSLSNKNEVCRWRSGVLTEQPVP